MSVSDCFIFPFREKGERAAGVWSNGRRSRELSKNGDAPFATGLIIGKKAFLLVIRLYAFGNNLLNSDDIFWFYFTAQNTPKNV